MSSSDAVVDYGGTRSALEGEGWRERQTARTREGDAAASSFEGSATCCCIQVEESDHLKNSGQLFAPVTSLEMMADVTMLANACASALGNKSSASAPDNKSAPASAPASDIFSRGPAPDGFNWRKYGEKRVKQSPFTRSYYKCSVHNCPMRKIVELDGQSIPQGTIYKGGCHNHIAPATNRPLKIKPKRPV